MCSLFCHVVLLQPRFFSQGLRRYIMKHVWIPAELHGACSEHSKPLSWLFCQGVVFRLTEPSRAWKAPHFFSLLNSLLRSSIVLGHFALPPTTCHHRSIFFTFFDICYDAAAATVTAACSSTISKHFFVTVTDGASCVYVCALLCVCVS